MYYWFVGGDGASTTTITERDMNALPEIKEIRKIEECHMVWCDGRAIDQAEAITKIWNGWEVDSVDKKKGTAKIRRRSA